MQPGLPISVYKKLRTRTGVINHRFECTLVAAEPGRVYVRLPCELGDSLESVSLDNCTSCPQGSLLQVQGFVSNPHVNGRIAKVLSRDSLEKLYRMKLLDGTDFIVKFSQTLFAPRVRGLDLRSASSDLTPDSEQACEYLDSSGREHQFKISLPPRFGKAPAGLQDRWPLLMYLPGEDGRSFYDYGDEEVLSNSPGLEFAFQGFVVVSPMVDWRTDSEATWLKELIDHFFVANWLDRDRIYLTGYSAGGMGTWMLASCAEHIFTAIAPVSSYHREEQQDRFVEMIERTPVCIVHSTADGTHPLSAEETLWRRLAIQNLWMIAFLCEEPCCGGIRRSAYCRSDCLYKWLLSHTSERVHDRLYDP